MVFHMKKLHWMILRLFPGPFFGALGLFMFLILMQFLMQNLPKIVGKGLDIMLVFELIAYNLAYMFTLAVPMSLLLATLFTFAKLIEFRYWMVIRNAGVSFLQVIWPLWFVSALLTSGMWYFANELLPIANYRISGMWMDIQQKKPDFLLEEAKFYSGLQGYTMLVKQKNVWTGELRGVYVFDYTKGNRKQAVLVAERGYLTPSTKTELKMTLYNGEFHRYKLDVPEKYEKVSFKTYETWFDVSELIFKRENKEGIRSDRTLASSVINHMVDSMETELAVDQYNFKKRIQDVIPNLETVKGRDPNSSSLPSPEAIDTTTVWDSPRWSLQNLSPRARSLVYTTAIQASQSKVSQLDIEQNGFKVRRERINQYIVEVYKKETMAFACFVFMLLGAPLGLYIRRGGLGMVSIISGVIFIFFWAFMVQGEKYADRSFTSPLIMWLSCAALSVLGLLLMAKEVWGFPNLGFLSRLKGVKAGLLFPKGLVTPNDKTE